mmetsp:Transcript_518/g.1560  ORF Transcript_518/g.1560 Transcript_518/m.1560 type:complete len:212 (-) Transcript_518:1625-2260(-)
MAAGGGGSAHCHGAPSTANLQHLVSCLDACLLDHGIQLVVLSLLQRLPGAVDAARVGHGLVQKQLVHVIAGIVVLLDVLPGSLNGVAAAPVGKIEKLATEPVEDPHLPAVALDVLDVCGCYGKEASNVVDLKITVHVALPHARVVLHQQLEEERGVKHTHRRLQLWPATPGVFARRHRRCGAVAVPQLGSARQNETKFPSGDGVPAETVKR